MHYIISCSLVVLACSGDAQGFQTPKRPKWPKKRGSDDGDGGGVCGSRSESAVARSVGSAVDTFVRPAKTLGKRVKEGSRDRPLGRLTVDLRSLLSDATYDCWLPLQLHPAWRRHWKGGMHLQTGSTAPLAKMEAPAA